MGLKMNKKQQKIIDRIDGCIIELEGFLSSFENGKDYQVVRIKTLREMINKRINDRKDFKLKTLEEMMKGDE